MNSPHLTLPLSLTLPHPVLTSSSSSSSFSFSSSICPGFSIFNRFHQFEFVLWPSARTFGFRILESFCQNPALLPPDHL